MEELTGFGVGRGLAVGPLLKMGAPLPKPEDTPLQETPETAKNAVRQASAEVVAEIRQRAENATGESSDILNATALIAGDPTLLNDICTRIDSGKSPARAVYDSLDEYAEGLRAMGGYMAERASDLADVSQRIRATLAGLPMPSIPTSDVPFILAARDLAPADTAVLDFGLVKGLITEEGGPTGHTAVIARANGIPALVGTQGISEVPDGTTVLLDAKTESVIVGPSDTQIREAEEKIKKLEAREPTTGPGRFADGTPIPILANVGSSDEAEQAIAAGAEGIGLFRTEFLYLSSDNPPSLEDQVREYSALFNHFPGKKVVIRTLDAGADKPLPYLNFDEEPNPALGLRGFRATQKNDIGTVQLEAIGQACRDTDARVFVMAPMVSDAGEAAAFTKMAHEHGLDTPGIMAEVPSIAILADQVFEVCDFVSVGTNDLTQYAMAADRLLSSVARYQNAWHPAVLRLIRLLGDAAKKTGKDMGICGEAAADPDLAPILVGLGATSLSMAPSAIDDVRWSLRQTTPESAKRAADAACAATSASAAKKAALAIISED